MNGRTMLTLAIALEILGLLVGIVPMLALTPGTFLLFGVVSTPLLVAGMALYILYVIRELRAHDAL